MSEQTRDMDELVIESVIKPEDMAKLNDEANDVVQKINDTDSSQVDAILEQLNNFGGNEQRLAGESLNSLRRPVKDMMDNDDSHGIPDNLLKLREAVNELNPNSLEAKGLAKIMPKFMRRKSTDKYVAKYQSVE